MSPPEGNAAPADGGVKVGTVLGETYELVRMIGQGGMGAVWEARHLRLPGKRIAVKVLLAAIDSGSEAYTRFRREAEIASRLGHPNIVEVIDFNVTPSGAPYLVLELLQGESLAARLGRGAMPAGEATAIARQIGSALAAAHREGVVHRDLKPENVFLCPGEDGGAVRVKVLDFGISKITGSTTLQTQEQRILGTPQYMAPEQARGHNSQIDARTDVFALGSICYEMLAGKPAFSGDNLAEVVFKVVYEQPAPLAKLAPEAPAVVVAAIDKAMEKEPGNRHVDVDAMVMALTGRPLRTTDQPMGASIAGATKTPSGNRSDQAFAATMGSQDVALASTVASQDVPAPVPAVVAPARMGPVAAAAAARAAAASGGPATENVAGGGGGRGKLVVVIGGVLAVAGIVAYVAVRPRVIDGAAVAAAKAEDAGAKRPQPLPPVDAAALPAPPVADAAPAPVVQPDAAPKKKPQVEDDDGEDEPEDVGGKAAELLREGQAAFLDGKYQEAIRLARRSLNEKKTSRAFALIARSYCKLGDLGNAKAQLGQLGPRDRVRVLKFCKREGVDLQ